MKGLPEDEVPPLSRTMKERGHMILPLAFILYMLVAGYTPLFSAMAGLVAIIVVSSLRSTTRMSLKDAKGALEAGAKSSASVAVSCAIVGFIVGAVGMTGLGQVIAMNIMHLSGGMLWASLLLCMVASIVLGMGLPSTACYIVVATIAAPALQGMGGLPWRPTSSPSTTAPFLGLSPPLRLPVSPPQDSRGGRPSKVALMGLFLASSGLILPFFFVYNPVLLLVDFSWLKFLKVFAVAAMGILLLSCAFIGTGLSDMTWWERVLFLVSGVVMVYPKGTGFKVAIVTVAVTASLHWLLTVRRRSLQLS